MKLKINEIQSNVSNPRIIKDHKFRKLVKSIKEFPEMLELRPIVIDENNLILGGNMRHKACIEAGLKEVPVKIAKGLTAEQKQEFIVKDNVGFGEWDWAMLGNEWGSVQLAEWGLDVWQNEDEIEDIEEIIDFSESVNFIIKCDNLKQLEELQTKLNISASKLTYNDFLVKVKL